MNILVPTGYQMDSAGSMRYVGPRFEMPRPLPGCAPQFAGYYAVFTCDGSHPEPAMFTAEETIA